MLASSEDLNLAFPENSPASLWNLTLEYCALNPHRIFQRCENGYTVSSKDYNLPRVVCDALLKTTTDLGVPITSQLLYLFRDTSRTDLKRLDLRQMSDACNDDVIPLLRHRPTEISVSSNDLTCEFVKSINDNSANLVSLNLGRSPGIIAQYLMNTVHSDVTFSAAAKNIYNAEYVFDCPKLRAFTLNSIKQIPSVLTKFINHSLLVMPRLVYLDLSGCEMSFGNIGRGMSGLQCLQYLNVTNVDLEPIAESLTIIGTIKSLRFLDLSHSLADDGVKHYDCDVNAVMRSLIDDLQLLTKLDISSTNLAGRLPVVPPVSYRPACKQPSSNVWTTPDPPPKAIPWMDDRQLEYLGLLNCDDAACERENIPAHEVIGDANEKQILRSVVACLHKKELLLLALNNLFHHFKFSECLDHMHALQGILLAMRTHLVEKTIQISGSASLFYVVKGEFRLQFTSKMKKEKSPDSLNAMERYLDEPTMLRNGCLSLCNFSLPQDVFHFYSRLVSLLLKISTVVWPENDHFVQRISIYLLNALACQVESSEKLLIGDLGSFKTMLHIISGRCDSGLCDEVMEVAWSMMWNVTDETAKNSERFISEQGMDVFLRCLEVFPERPELLRNMMGLVGNVAEVEYLRPRLMQSQYVQIFSDLLESVSDGIEVSYNACGVLANLMSDGPSAWTVFTPSREVVLDNMRAAIRRWKLNTKRNINYRSFRPILRLLALNDTPQVKHWAVWALCNLTKMYKSKYCPLLEKDGGIELLTDLLNDSQTHRVYPDLRPLVEEVLDRCRRFKSDPECVSADEEDMTVG